METALSRYLRWQKAEGHSPRTWQTHQQYVSYFMSWCKERGYSTALEELQADTAREWVASMQDRGLSPHTISARLRSLKAFSRWLFLEEWLAKDPLARVRPPKLPDITKDVLDPKDVDKLLNTCPKDTPNGCRDAALILLLYSTGIRAGELLALKREDVDLQQGLLLIRRGKGAKFRFVPLGGKAERALNRYLAKRSDALPNLFLTDEGLPITYSTLKELMRRKSKRIDRHLHLHLFRHSFAIQYLRNGGRLEHLRAVMGHSKYELTLHYARIAGIDVVEGHIKADPANALKSR